MGLINNPSDGTNIVPKDPTRGATTLGSVTHALTTYSIMTLRRGSPNIALKYALLCGPILPIMLKVILLNVVMLSVVMLSVIMLSVAMRSVDMLSVVMLSVDMLSVIMLSVVMLSVVMVNI
jgi:hypothetical protein